MILSVEELIILLCTFGEMFVQILSSFKNVVNCLYYIVRASLIFWVYDLKQFLSFCELFSLF